MFNVIYSKYPSCNLDYFISKDLKNNKFLYECVECKLEVTFLHVQPDLYLESREDYTVFIKKYKLLNLGDLRYTIFQANKNRKHVKEIEEEQKNRLIIRKGTRT
ncbi:hypothetical protein [Lysinibacillus fusiformis]|uniref:hypothetical protein n=1 Tax=Lysinibacillus fusiformis TaxID=28031 RepID=UPI00187DF482|nr:hypothetical protein [Lysinibacillus fusiformis]MBD8522727.1 hypothetical protein [Lysinibacillus fusiformis]